MSLLMLPHEVLCHIVSYLPFPHHHALRVVCKRFNEVCADPVLHKYLNFVDRPLADHRVVARFLRRAAPVEIDLLGCLNITDNTLQTIATRGAELRVLR